MVAEQHNSNSCLLLLFEIWMNHAWSVHSGPTRTTHYKQTTRGIFTNMRELGHSKEQSLVFHIETAAAVKEWHENNMSTKWFWTVVITATLLVTLLGINYDIPWHHKGKHTGMHTERLKIASQSINTRVWRGWWTEGGREKGGGKIEMNCEHVRNTERWSLWIM